MPFLSLGMASFLFFVIPLIIFVLAFVSDVRNDAKKFHINDLEGDLHILREFRKDFEKKGLDISRYDEEIKILEERIKRISETGAMSIKLRPFRKSLSGSSFSHRKFF